MTTNIKLNSNRFVDENEKLKVQKFFELMLSLRTLQLPTTEEIQLHVFTGDLVIWTILFSKEYNSWRLSGSNGIYVTINPTISDAIDLLKNVSLTDIEDSVKKWSEKYGINI